MSNADINKALETINRERGEGIWKVAPVFAIELDIGAPEPATYTEDELEEARAVARKFADRGRKVTLRRVVSRVSYVRRDSDDEAGRNVELGFCPDGCCAHHGAREEAMAESDRLRRVLAAFRTIGAKGAARFA